MNNNFDSKKYNILALKNLYNYKKNKPFPHIQFLNFLKPSLAKSIFKNFPSYNDKKTWIDHEKYGKNINTNFKRAQHDERKFPKIIRNFCRELNSQQFLLFLETLTGIDGLLPDPYMIGGGIHVSRQKGYLNIHTDFNWHHKLRLHRRVNVLIYFTPNWKKEYMGNLELYDRNKKKKIKEYMPTFNSCTIFNTSNISFHGHPEAVKGNNHRRVINMYYYTAERKKSEIFTPTFTSYGVLKKTKINKKKFDIKNSPFALNLLKDYKKLR